MQDRVPLYPGRVRLNPVTGQTNVYDMTLEDSASVQGTPLNKASLLNDFTAAKIFISPDGTETPSDALSELVPKVGQMMQSVRTDYGAKWLLCDGSAIDPTEYPDLALVLGQKKQWAKKADIFTGISDDQWDVATDGSGLWVAIAFDTDSGSHKIYYSESAGDAWTYSGYSFSEGAAYPVSLAYGNGNWVIAFSGAAVSRYTGFVKYTTTPKDATSWSQKSIIASPKTAGCIQCYSGIFVVNTSAGDLVSASTPSGTWSTLANSSTFKFGPMGSDLGSTHIFRSLTDANKIIVNGSLSATSAALNKTIFTNGSLSDDMRRFSTYTGTHWVVVHPIDGLFYTTTPYDSWTNVPGIKGSRCAYDGTNVIVGDDNGILYYTSDVTSGNWSIIKLGSDAIKSILYGSAESKYQVNGKYNAASIDGDLIYALPDVQSSDFYTYIRGVE